MKKKIAMLLVSACTVLSLVACGGTDSSETTTESSTETSEEATTEEVAEPLEGGTALVDMDLSLLTMPEYKGIEVQDVELIAVTDEDVQMSIDSILSNNPVSTPVTDRAVETGDTVNIDYVGTLDGVAFDGGTAAGYDLTIGAGQFIDGFEDGIIGAEIGDVLNLDLTFPEEYPSEDLAGQAVVFEVTVNSISVQSTPELTDELVQTYSTVSTTVEEYKEEIRASLETDNLAAQASGRESQVWAAIIDQAEVSEYPEEEMAYFDTLLRSSYESQAEMYGMTIDEFVESAGMTMEDYEAYIAELSQEIFKSNLAIAYIANEEGLMPTVEEFDTQIEALAVQYGFENAEAFYAQAARTDLEVDIVTDIVVDWLVENSVFVEATETESTELPAEQGNVGTEE